MVWIDETGRHEGTVVAVLTLLTVSRLDSVVWIHLTMGPALGSGPAQPP